MPGPRIAVVGAGIVGVLTARTVLDRVSDARVTLVDRDSVGSGASRRSAGLHFPRGASVEVRDMTLTSERFYAGLLARDPGAPIRPVGMTVVASAALAGEVEAAYLPSARLTPASDTGDPAVALPPGHLAWSVRGGQYADVEALTRRLAAVLGPEGRREGVAVTAIAERDPGVRLSLSTGETLDADAAVIAPGPWVSGQPWSEVVTRHGVRVKKIVALHVDRPVRPGDGCTVFHDEDAFLLPLAHRGHWLFSYTCNVWDVDPDEAAPGLHGPQLDEALAVLARYAPNLVPLCHSGRVFCDAYAPDRRPVVRTIGATGRLIFAGAVNGSGYRLAPAVAAAAADLLDLKGLS
jgi:glycine/D-amino acid oxidase-like deaminating enzyme